MQWTRLPERLKTNFSEGAPTFAAQFRFNPSLDPFRGQPRFRALAAEVDQFYAGLAKGGAKPAADRSNEPR